MTDAQIDEIYAHPRRDGVLVAPAAAPPGPKSWEDMTLAERYLDAELKFMAAGVPVPARQAGYQKIREAYERGE